MKHVHIASAVAIVSALLVARTVQAQPSTNEAIPTLGEQSNRSALPLAPAPTQATASGATGTTATAAPPVAAPNDTATPAVAATATAPSSAAAPGDNDPGLRTAAPAPEPTSTSTATSPAATMPRDLPPAPETKPKWIRDGFYLRIVSGTGYATFRGEGPTGAASISGLGASSMFAIGGSIAPGLVLAGTITATQTSGEFKGGPYRNLSVTSGKAELNLTEKATAAIAQFGALLDWYPSRTNGAHIAVGAGLGMVSVANQIDDSAYYGMSGAATLLAGYDWSIAPTWALGLSILANGSTTAGLKHAKTGKEAPFDMAHYSIGVATSILYF